MLSRCFSLIYIYSTIIPRSFISLRSTSKYRLRLDSNSGLPCSSPTCLPLWLLQIPGHWRRGGGEDDHWSRQEVRPSYPIVVVISRIFGQSFDEYAAKTNFFLITDLQFIEIIFFAKFLLIFNENSRLGENYEDLARSQKLQRLSGNRCLFFTKKLKKGQRFCSSATYNLYSSGKQVWIAKL